MKKTEKYSPSGRAQENINFRASVVEEPKMFMDLHD